MGGAEGSRREPTVLRETPAHIFEGKNFQNYEVLLIQRSWARISVPCGSPMNQWSSERFPIHRDRLIGTNPQMPWRLWNRERFFTYSKKAVPNPEASGKWGVPKDLEVNQRTYEKPNAHIRWRRSSRIKNAFNLTVLKSRLLSCFPDRSLVSRDRVTYSSFENCRT